MAAPAVCLVQYADFRPAAEKPAKLAAVPDIWAPANISEKVSAAIAVDIGARLVLLHHAPPKHTPDRAPSEEQINEFAALAIAADGGAATAYFEAVRAQYRSFEVLLSFFLAPAAQRLGELWRLDECNFFDVTVGVGRLKALMDRLASEETTSGRDPRRHAMLIALPGETHLFGIQMVARLLESTGWSVVLECGRLLRETAKAVAEEWIGVVGLTVSSVSRIELAAATIGAIRRSSANSGIGVMVGGAAFADNPDLATQVGADAVGSDATTAVLLASHLLRRQSVSI